MTFLSTFAYIDWMVIEDVGFVLLAILVWKLYRTMREAEHRLKDIWIRLWNVEEELTQIRKLLAVIAQEEMRRKEE